MPQRKAVQVTTTTHAYVLTWYVMLIALGVLHAMGVASHSGMDAMIGPSLTALWALLTVVSGITAAIGAVGSRFLENPTLTLWLEALGVLGLVGTSAVYIASLWTSLGPFEVVATQVPQWAIALGGLGRIAQVWVETRRIRRAVASPTPVTPPLLAEVEK